MAGLSGNILNVLSDTGHVAGLAGNILHVLSDTGVDIWLGCLVTF